MTDWLNFKRTVHTLLAINAGLDYNKPDQFVTVVWCEDNTPILQIGFQMVAEPQ